MIERQHKLPDVVGLDQGVPLLDGGSARYVNLDNAASTPPLLSVLRTIQNFAPYCSSVHRGAGFKSRLSTAAYEQARDVVAEFVGADPTSHTVLFGKNTTEAINKLAYRFPLSADSVVLTTALEHHSNDLPWRGRAQLVRADVTREGGFDEADFDRKLTRYAGRVALVAVSGASNVTGVMIPIHRLARKAHRVGARILVDAAQLAPHRRVDMKPADHPEHLDFVALSAHKMYAPFGTGALVGPKEVFLQGEPEFRGGGTVHVVTPDTMDWAALPDRDEAGSPNVIGAVCMAAAARTLMDTGMQAIAAHERALTRYALRQLATVPGITIYGDSDPNSTVDRLGVIPFNLADKPHGLVAAVLGYEGAVGVRNGCFCAHPYVSQLLGINDAEAARWREQVLNQRKDLAPGMVRVSFGLYNTRADVDRLVQMLKRISAGDFEGRYQVDVKSGDYLPITDDSNWMDCFSLAGEPGLTAPSIREPHQGDCSDRCCRHTDDA